VLLKYCVPGSGHWWDEKTHRRVYPKVQTALQDAQRTLGLARNNPEKGGSLRMRVRAMRCCNI